MLEIELLEAVKKGDKEQVSLLLQQNANANARDDQGRTPLHLIAANVYPHDISIHLDMVALLLKANPDINTGDFLGNTPLHLAAESNNLAFLDAMMTDKNLYYLKLDIPNKNGYTTLMVAECKRHWNFFRILISKGANVNCSREGHTLLHCALDPDRNYIPEERAFIVEMIATSRFGCNLTEPNENGIPPLHAAVAGRNMACVKILMNAGLAVDQKIPVTTKYYASHTPLSYLLLQCTELQIPFDQSLIDIIDYLCSKGAQLPPNPVLIRSPMQIKKLVMAKICHYENLRASKQNEADLYHVTNTNATFIISPEIQNQSSSMRLSQNIHDITLGGASSQGNHSANNGGSSHSESSFKLTVSSSMSRKMNGMK